jgi:hypothetical protein
MLDGLLLLLCWCQVATIEQLLTMAKRLWDEEGISLRKSAERVQVSAAGCEALVVWVGCGSGFEGCVGWLFVLQAPTIPVEL